MADLMRCSQCGSEGPLVLLYPSDAAEIPTLAVCESCLSGALELSRSRRSMAVDVARQRAERKPGARGSSRTDSSPADERQGSLLPLDDVVKSSSHLAALE